VLKLIILIIRRVIWYLEVFKNSQFVFQSDGYYYLRFVVSSWRDRNNLLGIHCLSLSTDLLFSLLHYPKMKRGWCRSICKDTQSFCNVLNAILEYFSMTFFIKYDSRKKIKNGNIFIHSSLVINKFHWNHCINHSS